MARKRYSDEDALRLLREIDVHLHDGLDVVSAGRKAGLSDKTHCYWRKKFGGMGWPQLSGMRTLQKENERLKKIVADLLRMEGICAWPAEQRTAPYRMLTLLDEYTRRSAWRGRTRMNTADVLDLLQRLLVKHGKPECSYRHFSKAIRRAYFDRADHSLPFKIGLIQGFSDIEI